MTGAGRDGAAGRPGRAAVILENALIWAALAALWLLPLRRMGWSPAQGAWVNWALGGALAAMLAVALRRVGRWAGIGWRESRAAGGDRGRNGE